MPISVITPPGQSVNSKTAIVERTDTSAKELFGLPKGSIPLYFTISGEVASDAGTSADISVGISGDATKYVDTQDVTVAHPLVTIAGENLGAELTNDEILQAVYTETGIASTTGGPWYITVYYVRTIR